VDNKKQKTEFIICPVCEGSGKSKIGTQCPNCSGMSLGAFLMRYFFFWGPNISVAYIEIDKLRKKINLIVNVIAFIIIIIGLLSLAMWIYTTSLVADTAEMYFFWQVKNFYLLLFWLGTTAFMFVYYRLSEEERKQHRIKNSIYTERVKANSLPNNWDELRKTTSRIDVSGGFSPEALDIVNNAFLLANKLGHEKLMPVHLLFASLGNQQVAAMFSRLKVSNEDLLEKIKHQLEKQTVSKIKTTLSVDIKEVFVDAYLQALNLRQYKVSPKNFIIPCLVKDNVLFEIFYDMEIDLDMIYNVLLWFVINEKQIESYRMYRRMARFKPSSNMDRAYTSVATKILNHFGYDLTIAAKWGKLEYCVAREKEIENIFHHFESGKVGVLLVGPDGVGKNMVIDGIAELMVQENVPKFLQDKRLVELDATRLISGASPADAEGRMMNIMDEVMMAGNIVLFINNIESLIGITSGSEGSLDLSEVLASGLERQGLYCLASTTNESYTKYIEGKSLGRVMAKVEVKEPEGNQAMQIIESKIGQIEAKYNVYFTYNAIATVVKLSKKYMHDRYLPEKAITLLDLAAVKTYKTKGENSLVSDNEIAEVMSEVIGIPVTKVSDNESELLLNLESKIHERMVSQDEAVKMVSASLRRARTELREGKRPIASFLFAGPTGVGKTELAKAIAEVYFGSEKYMIRLDMSEYQHPGSIIKMIGDPDGTKGYLTEAVRKSPFSLILLDEFEKSHPDIMNLFLQVMDDGRLTDGQGRTIDFTNSIIIATSNAGAIFIQEQIYAGTPTEEIKKALINDQLIKVMRPELINRFDGVIVFEPLSRENMVEITKLMLNKTKKILEEKGINFKYDLDGARILAERGYDPKFGARPLRRLLQEHIDDQVADRILAGLLKRRDTLILDHNAELQIEKAREL
jgi:ATP-dependent Clp protease ATP-binding subunit ClpC